MRFSRSDRFEILDLGRSEYGAATERMLELVEERARARQGGAAEVPDRLLLCEFDPVLTVGRAETAEGLEAVGLPVHSVSRGGKATYHGPGQVVAYPILALEGEARDLHAYLHALEEALIRCVGDFGLESGRDPRNTGCWVNGRKIASIGVAVRRWVTYHGVALNVSTDLDVFRRFQPCGLEPAVMTTLAAELGEEPEMAAVRRALAARLEEVLRA